MKQQRTFVVMGEVDDVFREVRNAFEILGVRAFDIDDPQAGVLTGHTTMGLKSWGENLTAVIKPSHGLCEVTLICQPRLATTLVDGGKNKHNLDAIERRIFQEVPAPMAAQAASKEQVGAGRRAELMGRSLKH